MDAAESDSDDDCGPPIPDHLKMKRQTQECEKTSDDDDDSIGSPLPPGPNKSAVDSENLHGKLPDDVNERESERDEPQESEEEDEDDDDVSNPFEAVA